MNAKLVLFLMIVFSTPIVQAAPKADLWAMWDQSDPSSTVVVSHSDWQAFLNDFVTEHEDGVNRVDYAGAASKRELLSGYVSQLTMLDPRALTRDEQLAYWINLYNALTVEQVLRYPRKKSILRMGEGFFSVGPWDDAVATIAGVEITLNDIEHRILRPIWRDHRIHFAVNCASIGCPNLATLAYTAENAESLLASSERAYLAHERGVKVTGGGKLQLSRIFDWYRVDFADSEEALLRNYIAKHRPDVARSLDLGDVR